MCFLFGSVQEGRGDEGCLINWASAALEYKINTYVYVYLYTFTYIHIYISDIEMQR